METPPYGNEQAVRILLECVLVFFSIRLRSHFRLMSTALKVLFTTDVCVKQRMGSIETNNGVHTQRLHLAAKIKR